MNKNESKRIKMNPNKPKKIKKNQNKTKTKQKAAKRIKTNQNDSKAIKIDLVIISFLFCIQQEKHNFLSENTSQKLKKSINPSTV